MESKMTLISLAVLVLALSTMAQAATTTTTPTTPPTTAAPTTAATAPPTTAATTAAPAGPTTQAPITTTTLSLADQAFIAGITSIQTKITNELASCCGTTWVAATINTNIDNANTKDAKCNALTTGLNACNTATQAADCPAKLTAVKVLADAPLVCGSCSLIQASTLLMSVMAVMASLWSGRL